MSLVGTRPILQDELQKYELHHRARIAIKPGITTNITVVKEQEQPDGHFPTCPYPNPEVKEAMALGM